MVLTHMRCYTIVQVNWSVVSFLCVEDMHAPMYTMRYSDERKHRLNGLEYIQHHHQHLYLCIQLSYIGI